MNFFAVSGLLLGLSTFVFSVFFFLKGNPKTARVWAVFNLSVSGFNKSHLTMLTINDTIKLSNMITVAYH